MNEAVYRSPEWLKRFANFEIRTGDDLSGKEPDYKRWDVKWSNIDELDFINFYKDKYPKDSRERYRDIILHSDLIDIRNRYRGNFLIFDEFDNWVSQKHVRDRKKAEEERLEREKREKYKNDQNRIKAELDTLYNRIVSDFKSAPYQDKVKMSKINGNNCIFYTFEDGNDLFLSDKGTLKYKDSTYEMGNSYRNKFIDLFNYLFDSDMWKENKKRSNSHSQSNNQGQQTNSKSNHPKWKLYQNLKQTVIRREEQLRKMPKNDPDRKSLENEYQAAKSALDKMKNQYQFEHLKNFEKFDYGEKHPEEVDFIEDLFMEYADKWNMRPGKYISDTRTQPDGFNADNYYLWYTVYESFSPKSARIYVPSDWCVELTIQAHAWKNDIDKEELFSDIDKFLDRIGKYGWKYVESKTQNRKTFLNTKSGPGEYYDPNIKYYLYKD